MGRSKLSIGIVAGLVAVIVLTASFVGVTAAHGDSGDTQEESEKMGHGMEDECPMQNGMMGMHGDCQTGAECAGMHPRDGSEEHGGHHTE